MFFNKAVGLNLQLYFFLGKILKYDYTFLIVFRSIVIHDCPMVRQLLIALSSTCWLTWTRLFLMGFLKSSYWNEKNIFYYRPYYKALVYCLTRKSYTIRKHTVNSIKRILSLLGGTAISLALIKVFDEFLKSQKVRVVLELNFCEKCS